MADGKSLVNAYVGESLQSAPCPSAVLDLAKLRNNCKLMLDAVQALDVGFRAHVKTHKTLELTRYQIGHNSQDVRLIGSTLVELEQLLPLVKEYQAQGAQTNILYGIPPGPSHSARLAAFLKAAGPGSLSLLIDNVSQLTTVLEIFELSSSLKCKVFLKTDSGYHRAGIPPTSNRMSELVDAVLKLELKGHIQLLGFYSHNSLSYGGNSPLEAMDNLRTEVDACTEAVLANTPSGYVASRSEPIHISCGASPTALSLQNLLSNDSREAGSASASALKASLDKARELNTHFEIHAGVYPVLDMQQVSAASRRSGPYPEEDIAFSILTEVCSTYPDRTENPEALVGAGTIALGREPCKSYRGFGVVTGWNMKNDYNPHDSNVRVIVDRVSQEHGILQWEQRDLKHELPTQYGQRIRIWPNHACIAGTNFAWYLVIDSEKDPSKIVDVWTRWRGW